jgi:phospholipid/cholesterol/gamma-HCH transport system permease protein
MESMNSQVNLQIMQSSNDALLLKISGDWVIDTGLPDVRVVQEQMNTKPDAKRLSFDTRNLTGWDSGLLTFLKKVVDLCSERNIQVDKEGLPQGVRRLLALALAVPEKKDAHQQGEREAFFDRVGSDVIAFARAAGELIAFIGEASAAMWKLITGRASFRVYDLGIFLQECGIYALPIVSLISLLVGLNLAFVGIIQLKLFGAQVYVADLVGIGIVRNLGAAMTGLIMAGRTGAAFAAQLGTMQVNEEIDALKTLGIDPMEFLVLPRMLALMLMMPLLTLYANLMGILGGAIVGIGLSDINLMVYYNRTREAVGLNDLSVGLFMSLVFGVLVALSGCLRGMQCSRSASAVGDSTTSAVVTGFVAIIVATALITVVCEVIGI